MIDSKLFDGLTENEFRIFIEESNSKLVKYEKGNFVFSQMDECDTIYVLKKGVLSLEKIDINGKNTVLSIFKIKGEVMGEVYAYLKKLSDFNLVCNQDCEILEIPVEYFDFGIKASQVKNKIMANMMTILAEKAFFLNSKVRLLSSFTLRQKIANFIIQTQENGISDTKMTRDQMAKFMATTRPSLSRELINMEDSGLIELDGSKLIIKNREGIEDLL